MFAGTTAEKVLGDIDIANTLEKTKKEKDKGKEKKQKSSSSTETDLVAKIMQDTGFKLKKKDKEQSVKK